MADPDRRPSDRRSRGRSRQVRPSPCPSAAHRWVPFARARGERVDMPRDRGGVHGVAGDHGSPAVRPSAHLGAPQGLARRRVRVACLREGVERARQRVRVDDAVRGHERALGQGTGRLRDPGRLAITGAVRRIAEEPAVGGSHVDRAVRHDGGAPWVLIVRDADRRQARRPDRRARAFGGRARLVERDHPAVVRGVEEATIGDHWRRVDRRARVPPPCELEPGDRLRRDRTGRDFCARSNAWAMKAMPAMVIAAATSAATIRCVRSRRRRRANTAANAGPAGGAAPNARSRTSGRRALTMHLPRSVGSTSSPAR